MDGKARLAAISSEVGELHPILHQLFSAMPDMDRVFYTHGATEMGADFVLYRRDQLLLQTHHIGVVAKFGVVRQDHADVARQIDECFVPRIAPDGKGEILITEVWVLSTGEITNNAKSKIAEKYRGRKVVFLPGQTLASLIDKYLPDLQPTMPIVLQTFRGELQNLLDRLDSRTALVPGSVNDYVVPDVNEMRMDSFGELKRENTFESLSEVAERIFNSNFTLLESVMGGGKSRILRELCRHFLNSDDYRDGKIIPIYISCGELKDNFGTNLDNLCAERIPKDGLDMHVVVVVLLDGLDELKLPPADRADALQAFVRWSEQEGRRLVISTRPIDERQAFGPRLQNVCLLRIQQFRGRKALAFFSSICGDVEITKRITQDLANSQLVKALDATPIAYTLLARIMTDNNRELPASMPELFAKYFELMLGRWEIDKGVGKQIEFQAMQACLSRISAALLESGRADMPRSEAVATIDDYLSARPIGIGAEHMLHLMCDRTFVLFNDESTDVVGFRHKSFSEFFYALHLTKQKDIAIRKDAFAPFWSGVYYFLAGLQKDCPDLIRMLLEVPLQSQERVLRLLNFGNILQAAYMTPKKQMADALRIVFEEGAQLFLDVKSDVEIRELRKYSVMQLLGLFRMIVSEMYGYKSFIPALDDVICDLGVGAPDERDALALFFAVIAHAEAEGSVDFDSLIDRHGDFLPLELRFAIRHEAKKFNAATKIVKRMEKNLKSNLTSKLKGGSNDFVRRIYNAPIRGPDLPKEQGSGSRK